ASRESTLQPYAVGPDRDPPRPLRAPLGLFGFGLTTALLQTINTGMVENQAHTFVWAYGFFFGGLAQLVAGILEYQRRNTFGTTAFTALGCFWMGLAFYGTLETAGVAEASAQGLQVVLALWGIFCVAMWLCTFNTSVALSTLLASTALLFFFLSGGQSNAVLLKFAGGWGLLVSGLAFYTGLATLMEETYGRSILPVIPLGAPKKLHVGASSASKPDGTTLAQTEDLEISIEHKY
ncbi:GPR1/FUN34/yaaH family protein, partial [Helicosporidium sp. ATCC 50920]